MTDDGPLTYRDVATILALIDGPQRGTLTLAQGDMEIHVEKVMSDGTTVEATSTSSAEE
jgi:hypothetical protein